MLTVPAARITSRPACASSSSPPARYATPTATPRSWSTRVTWQPVTTVRLGRRRAGFRYPSATEKRRPFRCETGTIPTPLGSSPFRSGQWWMPEATAASTNAPVNGEGSRNAASGNEPRLRS